MGSIAEHAPSGSRVFPLQKEDIREDGRALHPVYLFQAKTPAESKQPWDVAKVITTTPAEEAWRPLNEGGCPLVKA